MHIVHAIEFINPATGGPAKVATSLALAQALIGHEVELVCRKEPDHELFIQALSENLPNFEKLKVTAIPNGGAVANFLPRYSRVHLRSLIVCADVVHVHGIWRPFNIAAAKLALEMKSKLVIEPHGMLDSWSLKQHRIRKLILMSLVWRTLLNSAWFIHALNKTEASLIEPLKLRSPVEIFANGVFLEEVSMRTGTSQLLKRQMFPTDRPFILFLGRLHYKKGIDYLIKAFSLFCKIDDTTDLVIAGPDQGMLAPAQLLVRTFGLCNRVHFVGPLYGEEKRDALRRSICFCLPSRQEGFSVAILEALAFGIPVIISKECHFKEVAEHDVGEVVSLDPVEICASLLKVVSDVEWRARAGAAAQRLVLSQFEWREIARAIVQRYENRLNDDA